MGYNARHIVTSMGCKNTRHLYEHWYCNRGNCELYIKELKNGLSAVRITEQKTKVKVEFMSDHPIRDKMRAALRKAA